MPMSLECALRETMDGWWDDLCQECAMWIPTVMTRWSSAPSV